MPSKQPVSGRPFIGMHFKCCNAYARIYLDRKGSHFRGYCPKCLRPVSIEARPGGAKGRFWTAE